jgi:hypothetical protein
MVAVWDVSLPSPVDMIDGIDDWVGPLRELVSLLSSRPNQLTWLQVGLPGNDRLFEVRLWLLGDDLSKDDSPVSTYEQLAPLGALANPCLAVSSWLSERDAYRLVRARLLGFGHLPLTFEEQRVANTAQTAEALHRLVADHPIRPKNEHRRWVREALRKTPSERKSWAKNVLSNANKLSLATRIEELVSQAIVMGMFLRPPDAAGFAKEISLARNAPAHGGRLPPSRAERENLYLAFQGLEWVIRVVLLARLGVSAEAVTARLTTNPAFRRLAQELGWVPAWAPATGGVEEP